MVGLLARLASLTPFMWGWFLSDLPDWLTSLNPFSDEEDKKAVMGWGLASLLGIIIIGIAGYFGWQKWGK